MHDSMRQANQNLSIGTSSSKHYTYKRQVNQTNYKVKLSFPAFPCNYGKDQPI